MRAVCLRLGKLRPAHGVVVRAKHIARRRNDATELRNIRRHGRPARKLRVAKVVVVNGEGAGAPRAGSGSSSLVTQRLGTIATSFMSELAPQLELLSWHALSALPKLPASPGCKIREALKSTCTHVFLSSPVSRLTSAGRSLHVLST